MKRIFSSNASYKINVSVCMATYNGEKFIREQIESILSQLREFDELVIVDDASADGTLSYLSNIADDRVHIHINSSNIGHVQSFAKSISLAKGRYIVLADQDDIWIEDRLYNMLDPLIGGHFLVSTNSKFINEGGELISPLHSDLCAADSSRYLLNISRIFTGNAFYDGCTMAFREDFRKLILPIPQYVESHDLWVAMAGNVARSNVHMSIYSLYRRIHISNASVVNRPMSKKLVSRIVFLISLIHIGFRLMWNKFTFITK